MAHYIHFCRESTGGAATGPPPTPSHPVIQRPDGITARGPCVLACPDGPGSPLSSLSTRSALFIPRLDEELPGILTTRCPWPVPRSGGGQGRISLPG